MDIYKVSSIKMKYGKRTVLSELAAVYSQGQFVALLGANGSGKSTFLRLLAQDEQPFSGDIFYHGQNLKGIGVRCREDVAFITENHSLPLNISLERWSEHHAVQYVRYDKALFRTLMERFDVPLESVFSALSRGQKMKALFALQAAKRPNVYLIDEITSVLDVGSRLELMNFLRGEVRCGALVIMTTNIGSELQSLATDVCYLKDGKMILNCKKAELKKLFTKFRSLTADMEKIAASSSAKLIHVNTDGSRSFLIRNDVDAPLVGVEIDKREVTIEDVAAYYTIQDLVHVDQ